MQISIQTQPNATDERENGSIVMQTDRRQRKSRQFLLTKLLAFHQLILLGLVFLAVDAHSLTGNYQVRSTRTNDAYQHDDPSRILYRIKRQQAGSNSFSSSSASQDTNQQQSGSGSSSSSGADSSGGNSQDSDKAPDEILSSMKCDFGTSEAPDLCKFHIIEPGDPLSKGTSTNGWSLGSGKLALFQGGPLVDASERNDTSGGYIFFETSNIFAPVPSGMQNSHGSIANFSLDGAIHQDPAFNMQNKATISYEGTPYGIPRHQSQSYHHNSKQSDMRNPSEFQTFQQYTSARVAINSPPIQVATSIAPMLGPSFASANLSASGPAGMCLSFHYAIHGLSAEEFRIHVNDSKTGRSRLLWASSESNAGNWTRAEVLYSATNIHSLVFSALSGSMAPMTMGTGLMSSLSSGRDLQRFKFRGYIAVDEIEVAKHDSGSLSESSGCKGHCNFDGDLCGWTNGENGSEDDFDWSFGRGSDNLFTGPQRDFVSSSNNELTGGYLFTDSGYPRRPGDRAILVSPMFQPTAVNDAMCMRFAVHMFGNGIGSLAIKIRYADQDSLPVPGDQTGRPNQPQGGDSSTASGSNSGSSSTSSSGQGSAAGLSSPNSQSSSSSSSNNANPGSISSQNGGLARGSQLERSSATSSNDLVIWEMEGEAGNSWHQAQTSVSSSRSPFQVVIEGLIGENHLGNMAIDEVSFSSGPCPTSPPAASKNYGDCTFEQNTCYWRNPDADIHLDDLDWVRVADEQSIHGPNVDHTIKKRSGSYMKLENTLREPKSGSRAFLLSPIFQPRPQGGVQCLSFYYYMFMRSISSSGPNLGTIRVYLASNNELVPIWRLTNPISSPSWKHARASLSTALVDGQAQAPTKLFQIAIEGIWGDAPGGAIALDDITIFDGACDLLPVEARSVPGECTFDVDLCSWSNKSTLAGTSDYLMELDPSRSPFLDSVSSVTGSGASGQARQAMASGRRPTGWQLATVDSRPVNLQDHTYKAPIGYIYVDVLDHPMTSGAGNGQQVAPYSLQSAEISVQSGQQLTQCLSFWFAAFGRLDRNQLGVYLTQASAPPPKAADSDSGPEIPKATSAPSSGGQPARTGNQGATGASESEAENSGAWRQFEGKLIWSMSLRNVTESLRRKWQYGQVALRADSNFIIRFLAQTVDGGFALDDISFYDGACETRPMSARVVLGEDEQEPSSQVVPKSTAS